MLDTDETTEVERPWLEIVISNKAHDDGNRICEIQPGHTQRKDGVDRLVTGKDEQSKRNREDGVE